VTHTHDIILVGGGSAGLTGARFAARLGARVALVERDRIGGDCTWTGCVPSKALVHAAACVRSARRAREFGLEVGEGPVDMARVAAHVHDAVREVYAAETPDVLRAEGIEVVEQGARFSGPHTVEAGDRTLSARRIVVCTGARPHIPPIPGLDAIPYDTYETIFSNEHLPRHLIVLGAGPVGLEIASAYAGLGSRVTVLASELLPEEDRDVREYVQDRLASSSIHMVLGPVVSLAADGDQVIARYEGGQVRGDRLLVATGRRPNVADLALERAGVAHTSAGIETDRYLRTSVGHIYAAGDVLGGAQFTHLAGWQCFQAVRNALLPGKDAGIPAVLPRVTFLDTEVASVGMSEVDARDAHGDRVRIDRHSLEDVDRAVAEGRTDGFLKVVSDDRGQILGATIVADRAGEMIMEVVLAMDQGFGLSELSTVVHPYPTWSSAVQRLSAIEATDRFLSSRLGKLALWLSGLRARGWMMFGAAVVFGAVGVFMLVTLRS